jgi:uncharacterized protein YutE (UPF0331/DUF86 family)
MIAPDLLAAKLADIEERTQMIERHRLDSAAAYTGSAESRDLVAFNLMLAVQAAADIAAHLISDRGFAPARSVAEGFARLAEHDIISLELASRLQRAAAFRNVVAHGYARLRLDLLRDAAFDGVDDLRAFASAVAQLGG